MSCVGVCARETKQCVGECVCVRIRMLCPIATLLLYMPIIFQRCIVRVIICIFLCILLYVYYMYILKKQCVGKFVNDNK